MERKKKFSERLRTLYKISITQKFAISPRWQWHLEVLSKSTLASRRIF